MLGTCYTSWEHDHQDQSQGHLASHMQSLSNYDKPMVAPLFQKVFDFNSAYFSPRVPP